ncbi:MAG: hypothetical protein JSS07_09955 [Proteobacteria bacterium]|nr:hypothetical protein [Pseudomonadota bacterium]
MTNNCEPARKHGDKAIGLDWGVETFATIVDAQNIVQKIEDPRLGKQVAEPCRRKEFAHQETCKIVKKSCLIATATLASCSRDENDASVILNWALVSPVRNWPRCEVVEVLPR